MGLEFVYACMAILFFSTSMLGYSLFNAWVEIKAMQKSTHQVQFLRTDPEEFQQMTQELKDQLEKDPFENIQ